jgi:hypothetical protein
MTKPRIQKWLGLFEQLFPMAKWNFVGLQTVQRCPRRRRSLELVGNSGRTKKFI